LESVDSAINASLGASLTPFPILSITLNTNTNGHVFAIAKSGLVTVEVAYPMKIKSFLFLNLSEKYPERTLRNDAVVSAAHSTIPTIDAHAPKDVRNNGIKGKIIWLLRSVNMLTRPRMMMFLVMPVKKDLERRMNS
jgi:hypothetical protein